jgi:hypothetical protein
MSRFGIRFQTPVGSSLETSERVLDQIEAFLRTRPEVDMYGGFVGGFGGGFPIEFNIRGRDWDELGRASRVIMERMRESGLVTDINSDY